MNILKQILRWNMRHPFAGLTIAFVTGVFVWGAFNWSMALTNSESFCISCHEMEENVYREYRNTEHYSNRTGVRATCPDCHVPKEWNHMVLRKIAATNELFQKLRGTIDTREKFLSRRPKLVRIVWQTMKNSNSRECRNCHSFAFMDTEKQQTIASRVHADAMGKNRTCIDCHFGITHELPEALLDEEHRRLEKEGVACGNCHADMIHTLAGEDWDWDEE